MTWTQDGDFEKTYYHAELTRSVFYKNSSSSAIVKAVELCGYCNGQFQIIVQAYDEAKYALLKQELIDRGFSKPDFIDNFLYIMRIMHDDLAVLAQLLKVITYVDSSFLDTEKKIFCALNIDQPPKKVDPILLSRKAEIKHPVIFKDSNVYAPFEKSLSLIKRFKIKANL